MFFNTCFKCLSLDNFLDVQPNTARFTKQFTPHFGKEDLDPMGGVFVGTFVIATWCHPYLLNSATLSSKEATHLSRNIEASIFILDQVNTQPILPIFTLYLFVVRYYQTFSKMDINIEELFVSQEVFVNLDPVVLEVLQEARWMTKLGVPVPKVILKMSSREAQVKALYKR